MKSIKEYFNRYKKRKEEKKLEKLYSSYGSTLYPELKKLKILLIYLEEVGVEKIEKINEYYIFITYKDGTVAKLWDTNKWQAWMSHGDIYFSNGENIKWSSKMPSVEVLYKYKKYIENYDNNEDISKYLPLKMQIKLQRKQKLLKIKKSQK